MIKPGDLVQCVRPAEKSPDGLPLSVPEVGGYYRVTATYLAFYGLGCRLKGFDPYPFAGFCLYVDPTVHNAKIFRHRGWYFKKVHPASKEFQEQLEAFKKRQSVIDKLKELPEPDDVVHHVYVDNRSTR